MYLKRKATVLISTVIILSLMSMLGCFLFKMMKNNNELSNLYNFDKDIYDLDKDEEEILNKFMKELNEERKEELENIGEEIDKNIFSEDFEKKIEDSILSYQKNSDKLFLITNKDNNISRKRKILYIFKGERIILIPTYKFEDEAYERK